MTTNFDFGGHINDENKYEEMPLSEAEEDCLSPYGVLCAKIGRLRARSVFETFTRIARRITVNQGGRPAILLDTDGGEFVSIHQD